MPDADQKKSGTISDIHLPVRLRGIFLCSIEIEAKSTLLICRNKKHRLEGEWWFRNISDPPPKLPNSLIVPVMSCTIQHGLSGYILSQKDIPHARAVQKKVNDESNDVKSQLKNGEIWIISTVPNNSGTIGYVIQAGDSKGPYLQTANPLPPANGGSEINLAPAAPGIDPPEGAVWSIGGLPPVLTA